MTWQDVPCDPYEGRLTPSGYARQRVDGVLKGLHVDAYEKAHGPVPGGKEVGHLCGNRACRESLHLHAVTHQENLLEGDTFAARKAAQTHCIHGHEFTPENTYEHPTRDTRDCRTCARTRQEARRARAVSQ